MAPSRSDTNLASNRADVDQPVHIMLWQIELRFRVEVCSHERHDTVPGLILPSSLCHYAAYLFNVFSQFVLCFEVFHRRLKRHLVRLPQTQYTEENAHKINMNIKYNRLSDVSNSVHLCK